MDFSTLALRREYCEREVALNRRTAPDLYLEARPIVLRSDGRLAFGGEGETRDWVWSCAASTSRPCSTGWRNVIC